MPAEQATILIVDDERSNLGVLLAAFNEFGFRVAVADNGESAIHRARLSQPDIILLDVLMPGIDGFETCRRLKADEATRDIPVIFMTALSDSINIVNGFAVGGVDYITKPFQQEVVLARINTHLMLRRQQKHIQQQNQRLQEVNASKDKFFAIIAHDLKSPFAGLLTVARLIKEYRGSWSVAEIENIVGKLQASVENLYALLENLLTWARIQQGVIECQPQRLVLRYLAGRNIDLFTPNAEQKQITLRNLIEEAVVAHADVGAIDTVLRNLISNAIKFTDAHGSVTVSAREDARTVEVAVADTGMGIPEANLGKLFRIESLYRRKGTAGENGTGLGLILCKEFIEKNGGQLGIRSEVGKGTTFTFTLPKTAA